MGSVYALFATAFRDNVIHVSPGHAPRIFMGTEDNHDAGKFNVVDLSRHLLNFIRE